MNPVCFFDSGIGGLPYLTLARQQLPDEEFMYIADAEHFPYGEKQNSEILAAVLKSVGRIIENLSPKCMVIACNTATVVALDVLRKQFPIPFIGVVPAIKPAAKISQNKKIAVLATLRTVNDHYLHDLIKDFATECEVSVVAAGNLRDLVEERFFSTTLDEKRLLLTETAEELKKRNIDVVVLGCTHFIHLEKEFIEVFGSRISIIDSREGVINQLERVLREKHLLSAGKNGKAKLYITGNGGAAERYRQFAEEFELEFAGIL